VRLIIKLLSLGSAMLISQYSTSFPHKDECDYRLEMSLRRFSLL